MPMRLLTGARTTAASFGMLVLLASCASTEYPSSDTQVRTGTTVDLHGQRRSYAERFTAASCKELGDALRVFHQKYRRYPRSLSEHEFRTVLYGESARTRREPVDGWDRPFHYQPLSADQYRLKSAGADGVAETGDDVLCSVQEHSELSTRY